MSLNNQNRLKNVFSELPTLLKFRSLVESQVKTSEFDPLIINSIDKADFPVLKELWTKYLDLPHLYYEKLFLSQRLMVYEAREGWKEQAKMTLSTLKLALSYINILEKLNSNQLKYKDLSEHCNERKQELSGLIIQVEELLKELESLVVKKSEYQIAFDEIMSKIERAEADLGFTFPFKDAFL
jgi:hypothetical protein